MAAKTLRLAVRLVPTAVLCVLLFLLSTPLCDGVRTGNPILFFVLYLLSLVGAAAINFPVMRGLASLVTLQPDGDSRRRLP